MEVEGAIRYLKEQGSQESQDVITVIMGQSGLIGESLKIAESLLKSLTDTKGKLQASERIVTRLQTLVHALQTSPDISGDIK